jgi:hypothetical protein
MKQKNIRVDVAGICSILHTCDGCVNASRRCCSWYEVTLSGKEVRCIDGCIPLAARYSPTLTSPDGYENVFEQTSRDHYSIDTTEDGVCAFAYFKGTRILCSLHSAAIKERIPFDQAKPQSCLLWPLAISDGMTPTLSVQDDAFEFHCNARSEETSFSLSPSIAMNIEWAFGREFLNKVQGAVDRKEPWITIRR